MDWWPLGLQFAANIVALASVWYLGRLARKWQNRAMGELDHRINALRRIIKLRAAMVANYKFTADEKMNQALEEDERQHALDDGGKTWK